MTDFAHIKETEINHAQHNCNYHRCDKRAAVQIGREGSHCGQEKILVRSVRGDQCNYTDLLVVQIYCQCSGILPGHKGAVGRTR